MKIGEHNSNYPREAQEIAGKLRFCQESGELLEDEYDVVINARGQNRDLRESDLFQSMVRIGLITFDDKGFISELKTFGSRSRFPRISLPRDNTELNTAFYSGENVARELGHMLSLPRGSKLKALAVFNEMS